MLLVDQATKAWARATFLPSQRPGFPWPGKFELTLTYNTGVAFGQMEGRGIWMAPIALGIAIAAGIFSFRNARESRWTHSAMGLLAAGAVGNLIDRIFFGKVTDMIYFSAINFPVFNIADSCITAAAIMLMVTWLRDATKTVEAKDTQISGER
jgi:signal peptidase II